MLCARINPERDFLFVAAAAVVQLQCKGNHLHDFGLALFQQETCFMRLAGHERLSVTVQHVNEHNVYLLSEYGTLRQCWVSLLCLQHRSYPSELLTGDDRATD